MHNTFQEQNSIHRDVTQPGLSVDATLALEPLCLFTIETSLWTSKREVQELQTPAHGEAMLMPNNTALYDTWKTFVNYI
jgi:hypothetical protein